VADQQGSAAIIDFVPSAEANSTSYEALSAESSGFIGVPCDASAVKLNFGVELLFSLFCSRH
jgi:hypothetical protein